MKAYELGLFRYSEMVSNPVYTSSPIKALAQAYKWRDRYELDLVYDYPHLRAMKGE